MTQDTFALFMNKHNSLKVDERNEFVLEFKRKKYTWGAIYKEVEKNSKKSKEILMEMFQKGMI